MTVPMVGHQVQSWLGKFCLQYIYVQTKERLGRWGNNQNYLIKQLCRRAVFKQKQVHTFLQKATSILLINLQLNLENWTG